MGAASVFDEISLKRAYRSKVKNSHPDLASRLGKDPDIMQSQFQEINNAFHLLLEKIQKENSGYTRKSYRKSRPGAYQNTTGSTNRQQARKDFTGSASSKSRQGHTARAEKKKKKYHQRNRSKGQFYKGMLPARMLRFAEYLYYTGEISWDELIHAIVWQYRNRPKLGELAESMGYLENRDVLYIIKNRVFSETFGQAALRLGVLGKKDLERLVRAQKMIGMPIGRFFLEHKIFTEEELQLKLSSCRRHNLIHNS